MDEIKLHTDDEDQVLKIWYEPRTSHSIYDICDMDGSVVKTGQMESDGARIDISDLQRRKYYLLILDGEEVVQRSLSFDGKEGN
ncbi:MAG: hypothetical protein ABEH38_03485 [Flavobacteriales bacterium]